MKYYKNKYIISIYNQDDRNVAILDNTQDFAEYFNISYANACMKLCNLFNHKIDYVVGNGKRLNVYFCEWDDKEYDLGKEVI